MNRIVLGGFIALVMVGIGLFWLQGRAEVETGAPPPQVTARATPGPEVLPTVSGAGLRGPAPPEASELTREQQRFFRYDRDRDNKITRNEMLSSRTDAFRRLDKDGNNLLSFEEWAVATAQRFDKADGDRDGILSHGEFATTAPPPAPKPKCACST